MRIVDKKLMATPRSRTCEYCGWRCLNQTERHHIVGRGHGGGNRMDVKENLLDLGGAFDCNCHGLVHAGEITKKQLWTVLGRKLGRTAEELEDYVLELSRRRAS